MKKRTRQTMNRFRMRAIAFVVVFAMALSAWASMPMDVFAESAAPSGKCGENLTWSLDESTKTLTISGNGNMFDYEYSSWNGYTTAPWAYYCHSIKSIQFNGNITSIGNHAFEYFRSLTRVSIPNSVNSIGKCAFEDCSSLTSISLPNTIKSIVAAQIG